MIHVLNEECTQVDLPNFATTLVLWRTAPTQPNRTTVLQVREQPRCRLAQRLQLLQEAAAIPSPQEAAAIPSPSPKNLLHTSNYGPVTEPRTGTAEALRKSRNALLFSRHLCYGLKCWQLKGKWNKQLWNTERHTTMLSKYCFSRTRSCSEGLCLWPSPSDIPSSAAGSRSCSMGLFCCKLTGPIGKKNAEE